ncbi:serine/threonine-protein phosphatase [bacterium]|nr:serine/threonine-protein phosphatase [bacterium]
MQHWRVMLLAWDRLQDENEADHALSLLALFQPAFDALLQRAEQSGLARLADSIESLSARLKQAAFETPSYAGIAAAAGLAAQAAAGITVAGATDTGRRRQHNEDAWLNFELRQHSSVGASFSLAAIADGMGGHASGEVASSLALDLLRTQLAQTLLPPRTRQGEAAALGQALRGIIPGISRVLQERSDMEPQLAGMGTTIVGLASLSLHSTIAEAEAAAPAVPCAAGLELFGNQPFARAASVLFWCGDSRAYLLGPCGLARLSADHSYVQELLDSGQIDSETAFSHPQKNIITRCLGGGGQNSEPDLLACAPGPGELVLLCSDGLSDALRDSEIWELARTALAAGATQGELIQALIDGANAAGGPDNITVLLLQAQ